MSWLDDDRTPNLDQRREIRRKIRILCIAYDPRSRLKIPVQLCDLSHRGALIRCDDVTEIPDEFILLIRGSEAMRRYCVVARRSGRDLGVTFRYR
ncbi:PilZ domain-containing protein [Salinarimonas sp.]|uniref:PilZ domain-containing protein n=1 Tax=Salinarimonas sp. TaxID=2766526 RepID=UPI0032D9131D